MAAAWRRARLRAYDQGVPEAPVDFSGVRLKLAGAGVHLDALRAEVAAFQAADPIGYDYSTTPSEAGALVYTVRAVVRAQPPVEWAAIIGDVLHNLRSALDHAVWAMADPAERNDRAQYPIYDDEARYDRAARELLSGVSPRRRELIRSEQPFHYPDDARPHHSLGVLARLSNDDKHRALRPIAFVPDSPYVVHDGADIDVERVAFGRMLRDGDEIMRFVARPRDGFEPTGAMPSVSFEIGVEGTVGPMLGLLGEMARRIEHHVILPLEHPDLYTFLPLPPDPSPHDGGDQPLSPPAPPADK
jgi:hypothetical protein